MVALPPEAPPALLESAHGTQEVHLAEGGPEHVGEIEFAVGALPQQEPRKADLAAGPDDELGIGEIWRIEIAADRFGRHQLDGFRQRPAASLQVPEEGLHRVGDLLAPAI